MATRDPRDIERRQDEALMAALGLDEDEYDYLEAGLEEMKRRMAIRKLERERGE